MNTYTHAYAQSSLFVGLAYTNIFNARGLSPPPPLVSGTFPNPRILLNNGVMMPQLALGTWQYNGSTAAAVREHPFILHPPPLRELCTYGLLILGGCFHQLLHNTNGLQAIELGFKLGITHVDDAYDYNNQAGVGVSITTRIIR